MTQLSLALREAEAILAKAGVASPLVDAKLLAAHFLGCSPLELHFRMHDPAPEGFAEAVARRAEREPLQYITGTAPFGPFELAVGPGVFIPRPETEVLADWAVQHIRQWGDQTVKAVDLCTGSGALAAYIANATAAEVWAVERSAQALDFAQRNLGAKATVVQADAGDRTTLAGLAHLRGQVDIVVSNPPYVPESTDLDPEVYHDPHDAVFAGEDGMALIPSLLDVAYALLKQGGVLGVEHDDTTSPQVQAAFRNAGFANVEVLYDFTGRARFVLGSKLSPSPEPAETTF